MESAESDGRPIDKLGNIDAGAKTHKPAISTTSGEPGSPFVIRAVEVGTEDHREIASLYENISDELPWSLLIEAPSDGSVTRRTASPRDSTIRRVTRTESHVYVTKRRCRV